MSEFNDLVERYIAVWNEIDVGAAEIFFGKMGPLFSAGGARKFFSAISGALWGPRSVAGLSRHFPASGGAQNGRRSRLAGF